MTEGTSPSVTGSVGCDEASLVALRPALFEGASPSAISSVKYDEASSVVRGSERAERRSPSLNGSARYDKAFSVAPRSELGDRPNLWARSSDQCRPSAARLRSAGGADAIRRVRLALSETSDSSSGVTDSFSESLPSPEYTVHRPVNDPSLLSLTMYDAQSVACDLILALPSSDSRNTFSVAAWALAENDGSWEVMLSALYKAFVSVNVTPARQTLERCDA
jgi:hypothetical protein